MAGDRHLVESIPEILGGMLVFAGTRVPVDVLSAFLERGKSLDEFLECFPTVSREQAVSVLAIPEPETS